MHPKMISLALGILFFVPMHAVAQSETPSLITQRVDDSKLTVLKGNTHPSARTQFDRGAAPASLPMERMLLVLKRSPEQQAALDRFLAELGDKSSVNYHKWLTPEKFGQEFGPSEGDIQTVTSWLQSHGFQIGEVAKAHNVIEFSGTVGQVEGAFHTSIHNYVVNGEEHWANSSDPQIPTALVPVVVGVKSLHNFLSKPLYHPKGTFTKSKSTGEVKPVMPSFTFSDACGLIDTCYALTPYDFATIYNVLPLWNAATPITGTGESIGIVGRVTVNIADMENFRIFVGLPPNNPVIIVNGTPPGTNVGDEGESDLDMQWAGGVAKNATIDFVTSASTNTTDGVDLSAEYILDNNLTSILSYSYGLCEVQLGVAGNAFSESLWEQAVGQGITVLVATGDTGSTICEDPQGADDPGTTGLAVNGIASTPNNVAVGGTDFDDWNTWVTYWSSTNNTTTLESAISYIPEMAYNDTCTNFVFGEDGFSTNLEANCNNAALASYTSPFGGGGGASTVYTKPAWQTGVGVPADGARDLPDLSLFAGDGTIVGSAYVVCQADNQASCTAINGETFFDLVGGTSVSTQVFAGIMAMVDQKAAGREGNANLVMYPLAATPAATSCNSSSSPSSTCYFYDVTLGTNAMPCVINSPNCTTTTGDTIGITETNGVLDYNAGVGYDLATGLGSVNAENFVNAANWTTGVIGNPNFTITSSAPTLTITSPGSSGMLMLTITSVDGYTGTFNLSPALCSGLPSESACSFSTASASVSPGSTTATFTMTITTTAPSAVVPANRHSSPKLWPVAAFALSCLLALGLLVFNARGNRRWSTALALVVFGLLISISACGGTGSGGGGGGGGGSGGTPTGSSTGTVTITDVAGTTTHSFSFTITVN